jgi:hypothetical protein
MSLCLVLERGLEPSRATAILQTAAEAKGEYAWLAPPATRGAITVKDVHGAGDASEHRKLVRTWADSAWSSWSEHHTTVHAWLLLREPRGGG